MVDKSSLNTNIAETYFVFMLEQMLFALPVQTVNQIIKLPAITPMPGSPEHIQGLFNLQGQSIVAMDLRLRFGYAFQAYNHRTCVVVLGYQGQNLGLIVDAVQDVVAIPERQIQKGVPGLHKNSLNTQFINRTGFHNNLVIRIIDLDRLMQAHLSEQMQG